MPKLKVKMQSCSIREGRGDGSKASTVRAEQVRRPERVGLFCLSLRPALYRLYTYTLKTDLVVVTNNIWLTLFG